ncbi:hypothetical protein MLD52_17320 [Puniceicoccaceae bacterium K14]|nr:hypothetical protein [Puniceicoccaceae bacterium K14]
MRLNVEAVKPLLDHIKPLIEALHNQLASPGSPPDDEDEDMVGFWQQDLLISQQQDVSLLVNLFDDQFMETGRAILDLEKADQLLRACAALRLKLRECSLAKVEESVLESGEIDFESFDLDERIGYGAYMLFASLQEMIIAQIEGPAQDEPESDGHSR